MAGPFHRFDHADERYGDGRHPDLPWGYWLTSIGDVPGRPPLLDDEGRRWESVREAFWTGRLGLPSVRDHWANEIMEFMASYLAILDGRFVAPEERVRDVFAGDRHLDRFFHTYMLAAGLVHEYDSRPTAEGWAVLKMLIATRTREDADSDVGLDWIVANRTAARPSERAAAAERVQRAEHVASRMAHRFAADTIGGRPVVKLIGLRITTEIPVRSTLWSMSWSDGDRFARDRFYLWLLERIDRWDDWSAMVTRDGARALTEHLMRLAFCDRLLQPGLGSDDAG
ncbi:hypothetical protein [Aurantiacibacter spongiae]|uniref:Uncharacterized protein n=1 Tax=Aurantiacibacter spongiae TaxID=2488860 RepID=A0A3N5CQ21_9SPHN|nr:hypothetical protein [Aurantiacibacter spongiae]RPF71123.1 hypothetical protein EG799_05475 [Aurantiacibacter spongiae]